jgi:hypothetical protein
MIRNLKNDDQLPDSLKTGFEQGQMKDWIWVVERDTKIVAILIAAPAHVVAILLRLLSTEDAHPLDVRTLLVTAMKEIKERGFKAYVTWLNPNRPAESALLSIIQSAGGVNLDEPQVICAGRI